MLAKLICMVKGHKRGKRDNTVPVNVGEQGFSCPRCKDTWTRKAKT